MKCNKKYILILSFLLIINLVTACSGNNSETTTTEKPADKVYTLKAGHVLASDHPYHLGLLKMAEIMEEKSNGRLKMDVFPSSQLGNERDLIEGMQMGTIDVSLVSTSPLSGFSDEFLALDLPFLFKDRATALKVLDGEIGQGMLKNIENSDLIGLSFWENGYFNINNSKIAVKKPSDMEGLKIRTMENPIHMSTFKALGANPIPMAWGEVFTALQQNAIDGCTLTPTSYWTSKLQDANQKYLTVTHHVYITAPLLMSKITYDSLPDDLKAIVKEAAIEARDYERELSAKVDTEYLDKIKDAGVQIIEVDQEEWAEALQPVYAEYVPSQIPQEFMDKIQAANK